METFTSASGTRYETISNEIWRVTVQSTSANAVTNDVTTTREQMTGLSDALRSRTVGIAPEGSVTTSETAFNAAAKTLTTTVWTDGGTPTIQMTKFGALVEACSLSQRTVRYHDAFLTPYHVRTFHPVTGVLLSRRFLGLDETTWDPVYTETWHGALKVTGEAQFDAWGRQTARTDALGHAVTNVYDVLGRLVANSGATYPVDYAYDTQGRLTGLVTRYGASDAEAETGWAYDPATGLATNKMYADNSAVGYTHTPDGKPLRTTWARGAWREHAYDEAGLLATTTYSDATPAVSLAYDAFQRLSTASNSAAKYTYLNSDLGIATNETVLVGSTTTELTRQLDNRHRLAAIALDGKLHAAYSYDAENRHSGVSNAAFTIAYAYASDGPDAGWTITVTNGAVISRALTRDNYRRSLVTIITNRVNGTPITPLSYTHDALDRITVRNSDTFGYNSRSEVISADIQSAASRYVYDDIGNNLWTSCNSATNTYTANVLNQYAAINATSLAYDNDGNLLTNGVWSYAWDAENRLTAVFSNSVCIVSNAYDNQSRRIIKATPTATHTFVYDGWNLVQWTISSQQSTITNRYVWGKDLSGTLQGAGGGGGLLAVQIGSVWYFPLFDSNGNVTDYASDSGVIVASYTYNAFGQTITQSGPMADTFPHRFSTQYYDAETGLYYYGYRFYAPELLRWVNRDPAGEEEGENLYGFCNNDGNNNYDLTGLSWTVTRRMADPGSRTFTSQGDIAALAKWDSSGIPDFALLAANIGLDAGEVLQWARKDAEGTRFSSRSAMEDSCKFYIPNRILVIAHDAEHFRYRPKRYFSRRLNQWGERMAGHYSSLRGYAQLQYRYSYPQGGPPDGDRQIDRSLLQWPTSGFVITAHGKKGLLPEQRVEKGATVMYNIGGGEYQVTPIDFVGAQDYKFNFVYVASCFAGSQPWKTLASNRADLFVSPSWRAEAELFLPSHSNPPRW